jgi:DNA-binding CsgD family transcriptional regulator
VRQNTGSHLELISGREKEVLQMVAAGKTTKEIATRLDISARSVETYRVRLKRKLKARNVAELLKRAREEHLL